MLFYFFLFIITHPVRFLRAPAALVAMALCLDCVRLFSMGTAPISRRVFWSSGQRAEKFQRLLQALDTMVIPDDLSCCSKMPIKLCSRRTDLEKGKKQI